jgi:hypothetical protein
MKIKNPYRVLGIILAAAGAVLAPVFYFLLDSPALTATCVSAIILGFTCIGVANARPYLSPDAARMLLKTGMENTAALLEELGLKNKAVYLPSTADSKAIAIIPLTDKSEMPVPLPYGIPREPDEIGINSNDPQTSNLKPRTPFTGRLIVRYGTGLEDMAIAVTTPGSVSVSLLEHKPGPAAGEIESALNYLLTGVLDIAGGVTVNVADSWVEVKINDARMSYENIWYYRSLGSPVASIAAAVVSEALDKPIRILGETAAKGDMRITLGVVGK